MQFFEAQNSNIKVIIFDFDETMYYSKNIRPYYINFIKTAVMTLGGHNEQTAEKLMNEVGFTLENKNSPSFNSSLPYFNITRKQWDNYRIDHYFEIDYDNAEIIDNNLLKHLAQKYPLYIVSNELHKNILEKSKKMNIDLSYFKKIFAPSVEEVSMYPKKMELYKIIREQEKVNFNELFVIGDRIKVDINPMLELGGNALFIQTPNDITDFCNGNLL